MYKVGDKVIYTAVTAHGGAAADVGLEGTIIGPGLRYCPARCYQLRFDLRGYTYQVHEDDITPVGADAVVIDAPWLKLPNF